MKMKIKINEKLFNIIYYEKALNNNNYYQLYFGGSSSGKSYFLAQRSVLDVLSGRNYLICRKVKSTIRGSIFNEINKAIINFNLKKYFAINKTDLVITCLVNDMQICFAGLDDVEKVKSITPKKGVFTDILIEEATEISEKDLKQLKKRLRGQSDFEKRITIAFNPVHKSHWLYKYFFSTWRESEQWQEGIIEGLSFSILKTTYKDNEYLTEQDISNLENESDKYYYDVYTLGNWGVLGNLIYNNWEIQDISDMIPSFDNLHYGLDWGFYPDPFAFTKLHIDMKKRIIYVFDELYIYESINDDLINIVKSKHEGNRRIVADSSEPKSISEFKRKGVKIVGAKKGAGSIEYGIKKIQDFKVIIHETCINTSNEFSKYKYKESKDGEVLPVPVDKDNHILDAIRYAIEEIDLTRKIVSMKNPF